ncbi:MAG: RNA polymerase sigma factor [Armatimonadota bacterium]
MPYTDTELVRRVREGDLDAYGALIDRYQQRLVAAAHHLAGDLDAARDAVQETFIEAYRHLDQLRDVEKLGGWLYGILRHRVHAWLSRRRPSVSWDEEMVEEWYLPMEMETPHDLPELLSRLPAADRDALAARYVLDLSYDEIAGMLDTTAQNARVRVCRAKERLRTLLAHAEEEVGS